MKPPINLIHLKYFCDAVHFASISEAAKKNFVTQSTVSQAITKLEISLGVSLVVHARQKFQVSEEGSIVFDQASHIFKAVQDIEEKINCNKATITGSLKFVSTNSLGMSFIAPSYQKMRANYPQIDINFHLGNLNFIRSALRQEEAEFAIVVYDEKFSSFNKKSLKKGFFHLYHSINSPLTLINEGIIVDSLKSMHVESLIEYMVGKGNKEIKIQAELAAWEVVARFTEMNIGIGFFPDYLMANNRYPNLKIYVLDLPSFEYDICAIYKKETKLSRVACAFLDQFSC